MPPHSETGAALTGSSDLADLVSVHVTEGVFFTTPEALPRGRHGLDRSTITAAQRERAMIAATELLAGVGYRGVGVREICGRATISRAAFYECFADKDECIYAAYDRFIDVLVGRLTLDYSGEESWHEAIAGVVEIYLATLEEDLVVARAFQVEMDSLGRAARERRRAALVALGSVLRDTHEQLCPEPGTAAPLSAFVGTVYAVRQLASDALDSSDSPGLVALVPEISQWILRAISTASPTVRGE